MTPVALASQFVSYSGVEVPFAILWYGTIGSAILSVVSFAMAYATQGDDRARWLRRAKWGLVMPGISLVLVVLLVAGR